jgi:hypothetical protein
MLVKSLLVRGDMRIRAHGATRTDVEAVESEMARRYQSYLRRCFAKAAITRVTRSSHACSLEETFFGIFSFDLERR